MDLDEAERTVVGEQSVPRGTLTITASVAAGDTILRPILDSFMESYPELSLRLDLSDRPTNLIEQGIDLALRIATLADSNLVAVKKVASTKLCSTAWNAVEGFSASASRSAGVRCAVNSMMSRATNYTGTSAKPRYGCSRSRSLE